MIRPIVLLVNPAAGSGRAREQIDRAYAALRTVGPVELVESTRARDETRLATDAAKGNARALVVLGGDGSVSHAARGLIAARTATPLVIFAAGTGNDFAKSLGVPARDFLAMARKIESGKVRVIDAGEIDGVPFVNSAGFGFDVDVLQRTRDPRRSRFLRGAPLYAATAIRQLFRYGGFDAAVSANGTDSGALGNGVRNSASNGRGGVGHGVGANASSHWLTVVFANGQWFGGAFRIAPDASLDDGFLDVIGISDASPLVRSELFARALRGAHTGHRSVHTGRAAGFEVLLGERADFQADGEAHHARNKRVAIRCLPRALRVVV